MTNDKNTFLATRSFWSLPPFIRHSDFRISCTFSRFDLSPSTPYLSAMEETIPSTLKPGVRVKVTQQIAARHYSWNTDIVGVIVSFEQKQTGSWYAHGKGDKLWLDRLTLRKADGEITTLNLDEFTHIDIVDENGKTVVVEEE